MGDGYQYPVFFECANPSAEQRKKIESHFQIRRKSGGGECSCVIEVDDKVCSVSFKEQGAQQRVLQKCEHVVQCTDGPLVLRVRGPSSPHITASNLASSSQQKKQDSSPALNVPTSDEEYERQLDSCVLRYLKECPKVEKELQEKLTSVACSAQLYPEEDRVLVRRSAQPGDVDEDSDWKAEVDKILDDYMCHYEADSRNVKVLLQSCSLGQTTDEVKVYSEVGMAVVVGKRSQVKAKLANIEDSKRKHRGSSVSEEQTTVRRLGESKLRLLWKEIERSLGQNLPEVKVTQGEPGQLVLKGSVPEVIKAGELISEEENLVLERTISDKSPHFLAFLRKVYGGPGMLCEYLEVGNEVEVELRDTELNFFAFSVAKLDYTEKKLQEKFKDVKFYVPNCSVLPPELREMLRSKTNEMNQGQCKAQVVFGSDSTVFLLGHATQVEELSDTITQFILDQVSVEGQVILPFPDLVPLLPELLQLHKFDYSGVTLHPLTSSSGPRVALEGPANKVTDVRNRLGPLLDSLVQRRVIIDLPGAIRYFESSSGRDSIVSVAQSKKCLVWLEEQPHASRQNSGFGKYSLQDGLQVLVCEGDITKINVDALVNAANENLEHHGGVAAALSKAGGPEVQKESKVIVKQTGKIQTGNVVVTTGGNLKCKKLLHAVGPVGGKAGGKERELLEQTVQKALNLSEMMEFQSIAIPCISSGVFGVPVTVCCEAIVTAVRKFGSQGGRSLSKIILIDKRAEVVRAMKEACDRLLQGMKTGRSTGLDVEFQMNAAGQDSATGATAGAPGGSVHVEIVQGTIETQQVDALVSPMVGHDPLSTRVGNALSDMVGPQLTAKFHKEAGGATLPSETVLVESLPVLKSKAVFFLNQVCWDDNPHGTAVQALRRGIQKILASCAIRGFSSVAFPVLGTGAALRFPHSVAARVLLEEVGVFEQNRIKTSPLLVRIVTHPTDKESGKAFKSAQKKVQHRGFTSGANPSQESFYSHGSIINEEVTAMLGGVKLQMICGDIIKGGTDVIVNTTDFSNNQSGVSKAILSAAGPAVQAELAQKGTPADLMCTTGPGLLGCKEIIHASFKCDTQRIRKTCKKILKQCENKGYHSVAFPAVNTGAAGMDADKACRAMLDGMSSAIQDLKPSSLSLIRIVILQLPVFQAFRSELQSCFGQDAPGREKLIEKAKRKLKKFQNKCTRPFAPSALRSEALSFSKPQPAVINVISCGPEITNIIKRDLEEILQKQLVAREVQVQHLSRLDAMELDAVQAKVKVLGLSLEPRSSEVVNDSRAGNAVRSPAGSQSGQDVYMLKGLNEDVLSVIDLINGVIQKVLFEDLQEKEEAMLALNVQWSMTDANGDWQELNLHENYVLEEAHIKQQVFVEIVTPDGMKVKVNLRTQEATDCLTGVTYKVKRSQSDTALWLPEHWDPMQQEIFKKVELQPNSPEYQDVAQGFLKTAKYSIIKIERVQNLYLWHSYTVCRQRILTKNGEAELGEKFLYHGTSAESCNCIERDRFDRSFAGAHATVYGKGVYFAVNANYSAGGYSPPDSSGLKRLYVARVLTGRYTVGNSSMKATPPRGSDPTDCFDSLVNNQQQPSMFVIFHDDQAYPEYLITFS
ncbi:protein mono-ADP-ribosyltransferase PARP14-like [Acanthochromis polyacanthus]|uniref:protein mono-ADP-ribosyltransferase PARP14-like n=1 Tax=Acanthochromis polyacanthus TaxID=80966 RepID=UPI00223400DC|nr:protein mono-ADP-ribosyltransferase PARP14-like [Acanthochromis polyacanthus]